MPLRGVVKPRTMRHGRCACLQVLVRGPVRHSLTPATKGVWCDGSIKLTTAAAACAYEIALPRL